MKSMSSLSAYPDNASSKRSELNTARRKDMKYPVKQSSLRTPTNSETASMYRPERSRPLASGHHPPKPNRRRHSTEYHGGRAGLIGAARTPPSSGPHRLYSARISAWQSGASHTSSSIKKTGSPVVR